MEFYHVNNQSNEHDPFIILPAVDIRGGKAVRLTQGDYDKETVYSDDPASQAVRWEEQGATFLHLVDLDGARDGRPINADAIQKIVQTVQIPVELGGGMRTFEDAERILGLGVTRIILGTAACENPELVKRLLNAFDPKKIVIGIDARGNRVATRGWLEETNLDTFELAGTFRDMGVVRLIHTDIATDGMLKGPNFDSTRRFCEAAHPASVIASGGVSSPEHVKEFLRSRPDNLEGAIVGKALYDNQTSLPELIAETKRKTSPEN